MLNEHREKFHGLGLVQPLYERLRQVELRLATISPLDFEYNNLEDFVAPDGPPLPSNLRACHLVAPEHVAEVNRLLLEAGMCVLVPEDDIPEDTFGCKLVGGLFTVFHKELLDRLINDRRPLNAVELRLMWAELTHGTQLCQLVLNDSEVELGYADDLSKYFYTLKHTPRWIKRNCFGAAVMGDDYLKYGGSPG